MNGPRTARRVASAALLLLGGCRQVAGIEERRLPDPPAPRDTLDLRDIVPPPACSPDLSSDAHHCGACGHDCLGGACQEGECQPFRVSLTPSPDDNTGPLLDAGPGGDVYWWRYKFDGAIYRAPKSGGDAIEVIAALDGGWIRDVATDGQRLYFSNYSDSDQLPSRGYYSCAMDGTDAQQLVGDGVSGASFVALDGEWLYFENAYDSLGIGRVKKSGGPVEPLLVLPGPAPHFDLGSSIYIDDGWLYYSGGVTPISRMRLDGSEAGPIFGPDTKGYISGVHDGMVYWNDATTVLKRGVVDGSALPDTFFVEATGQLSFQDGWIYGRRGAALVRFREDEVMPDVEFVAFGSLPVGRADAVSLWWVEHVQGEVFRVAL